MCVCQVVKKLIWGLAMEGSRNMFALFEHNDTVDKAIESRTVVADVLAKFEKYVFCKCVVRVRGQGALVFLTGSYPVFCRLSAGQDLLATGWRFYFKLYCFLDTDSVPRDSVEFAFMFEQVRHNPTLMYPDPT